MSTITQSVETQAHWNDWPNDQGFDANYEEPTPVELEVSGHIPAYAAGTLYRTGPGKCKVNTDNGDTFHLSHWFDGFSQTHRFQLVASDDAQSPLRVLYNSRFSTDHLIEHIKKTGSMSRLSFGQKRDPCKTFFNKVQSTYTPDDPTMKNIGVTLSVNMPGIDGSTTSNGGKGRRWDGLSRTQSLYAKTDSSSYKRIDPETLEPIGLASQKDLHPELDGPMSAAHARSDPVTGDVYNFNLAFTPCPTYRVFCVSVSSGETTILATFPGTPAYLHSLLITEDYVILCVWNSHFSAAKLSNSFLEAILPFDSSKPATWYVVDRNGDKGLVATYESVPFFCFHTVNAWQEPSPDDTTTTDIVADLVISDSLDALHDTLYENIISSSPTAQAYVKAKTTPRSMMARFRLPVVPSTPSIEVQRATIEWRALQSLSPELPMMNPKLVTHKHRYTYGVIFSGKSTFVDGLMKFNSETIETILWQSHAQTPGEPIFVADPDGVNEDDGAILSVVLDGKTGKSYLLCLDAVTFTELGRAKVNGPVGFGFHGQHVSNQGMATGDY